MLKKVSLMVVALLAIAPFANAALQYQIGTTMYAGGSVITMTGNTTITVGIYNDAVIDGVPGITNGFIFTTGDTTLNGTVNVYPANLPTGTWGSTVFDTQTIQMTYNDPAVSTTKVGVLYDFGTLVGANGGTFVMTDDSGNHLDAGLTFATPEPATMALLAFGGLLLRRKK